MAIKESAFENEKELHDWVTDNLTSFLPGAYYLPPKRIATIAGKRGLPDGFAVNFKIGKWYILESELLTHGVWPHIAEQLTRYVVAIQNPDSRRIIRDHIFEWILENELEEEVSGLLNTTPRRLLQKLELFIEGIDPEVVVFIDDTNEDLHEMALALSAQVKIFRVQKYLVNGQADYLSPDQHQPTLETEAASEKSAAISEYDLLEELGGGELVAAERRFKVYELEDQNRIYIKRSKYYPREDNYWYSLTTKALEYIQEYGVTQLGLVMGEEGFVNVQFEIIEDYLEHALTSKNNDGSVRQYHLYLTPGPEVELYCYDGPRFNLADNFHSV